MGQILTSVWNYSNSAPEKPEGAADPDLSLTQNEGQDQTPILAKNGNVDSECSGDTITPVNHKAGNKAKVLPFDPRSPGIERSPIVVMDESGTPVATPTNKSKSKSLAQKITQNLKSKNLYNKSS